MQNDNNILLKLGTNYKTANKKIIQFYNLDIDNDFPGVYFIKDAENLKLLYIGSSIHVKQRRVEHYNASLWIGNKLYNEQKYEIFRYLILYHKGIIFEFKPIYYSSDRDRIVTTSEIKQNDNDMKWWRNFLEREEYKQIQLLNPLFNIQKQPTNFYDEMYMDPELFIPKEKVELSEDGFVIETQKITPEILAMRQKIKEEQEQLKQKQFEQKSLELSKKLDKMTKKNLFTLKDKKYKIISLG